MHRNASIASFITPPLGHAKPLDAEAMRGPIAQREHGGAHDQYRDQCVRHQQAASHTHARFLQHRARRCAEQAARAPRRMKRGHDRRAPLSFDRAGVSVHRHVERAVCRAEREQHEEKHGHVGRERRQRQHGDECRTEQRGGAAAAEARRQLPGQRHRDDRAQRKGEQRNAERGVAERQIFLDARHFDGPCANPETIGEKYADGRDALFAQLRMRGGECIH
jgi:hypothetical protein